MGTPRGSFWRKYLRIPYLRLTLNSLVVKQVFLEVPGPGAEPAAQEHSEKTFLRSDFVSYHLEFLKSIILERVFIYKENLAHQKCFVVKNCL